MIINKEVLNTKRENTVDYTNIDLFEYTLEVAGTMNDDIAIFMESMNDGGIKKIFDFQSIINAILEALLNALKKLFGKFLGLLSQLASMGSSFEIQLRAFKDKLKTFNGSVKLNFPYCEYTNLGENVPGHDIYEGIEDILQFYPAQYASYISQRSAVNYIADLDARITPTYEQNKFRNRLFGRNKDFETDCSDYAVRLNAFFRNNNATPLNGVVLEGHRIYNEFYIPYVDSRSEIKKIRNEQSNVEKEIRVIKQHINRNYFDMSRINQFDIEDQSKLTNSVISIQRKLCTSVDLMSQDLLMFFGQKLQAYKEFKAQCRKVLVLAIKACIEQGG